MSIYVSTGAFQARLLSEIVTQALDLGLTHLELSSGTAHEPRLHEQLARLRAGGIDCLVHNYFPAPANPFVLNLGSLDPAIQNRSLQHVRDCIDLTARLGKPYYSFHAAYGLAVTASSLGNPKAQAELAERMGIPPRDLTYAQFSKAVRDLADYAAEQNISLLIENNAISVPYIQARGIDPFLITTADEAERFMAEIGRTNVGLLVDVAHARVSASALGFDPRDFLRRTLPYAQCVHLSDNDGREDQNLPFTKESWFWPLLRPHAHRLDFVIEVYKLTPDSIRQQLELAHRMLHSEGT